MLINKIAATLRPLDVEKKHHQHPDFASLPVRTSYLLCGGFSELHRVSGQRSESPSISRRAIHQAEYRILAIEQGWTATDSSQEH